jgi:hypothetical protein
MSFDAERRAIEERLKAGWTRSDVYIVFDNVRSSRPEGQSWIRLTILNGSARQADLANVMHRHTGVIDVGVFVPENTGTAIARQIAGDVAALFKRATFEAGSAGRIRTRVPSIIRRGNNDGWYQLNVSVEYWRDEPQT